MACRAYVVNNVVALKLRKRLKGFSFQIDFKYVLVSCLENIFENKKMEFKVCVGLEFDNLNFRDKNSTSWFFIFKEATIFFSMKGHLEHS